jgi:hypothetical protein
MNDPANTRPATESGYARNETTQDGKAIQNQLSGMTTGTRPSQAGPSRFEYV